MKARVVIESPFAAPTAAGVEVHRLYARRCMLDSLSRGEAPFLGHLLYTQVLDDNIPNERQRGIAAHLAWIAAAHRLVFYLDYGMSPGMLKAKEAAPMVVPHEFRRIGQNP
jgi:hypothetical protein